MWICWQVREVHCGGGVHYSSCGWLPSGRSRQLVLQTLLFLTNVVQSFGNTSDDIRDLRKNPDRNNLLRYLTELPWGNTVWSVVQELNHMHQFLISSCQSQVTSLRNKPIRSWSAGKRTSVSQVTSDCFWLVEKTVCSLWLVTACCTIFLEPIKGSETRGAFHSMKVSGLNFRKFPEKTRTLQSTSKFSEISYLACVAGGISRASAFLLVAKPWTRVAKPWEDWWRVKLNFTRGFAAREIPCGLRPRGIWRLRRHSPAHGSRQLRRLLCGWMTYDRWKITYK